MRTVFVIFILIALVETKPMAQTSATKEETIDFITGRYELEDWVYRSTGSDYEDYYTYENIIIKISNCDCMISFEEEDFEDKDNDIAKYKFSFSDLTANETKIERYTSSQAVITSRISDDPMFRLTIGVFNGKELIKYQKTYSDGGTSSYNYGSMNFMYSSDEELLNRMSKAVNHMIKLCGGREEKF